MACYKLIFLTLLVLVFAANVMTKIVLPHKLRYLENMLSADAKAVKIRQRIEANPNVQDTDKDWPMLLAKYQDEMKYNKMRPAYDSLYKRRVPNY